MYSARRLAILVGLLGFAACRGDIESNRAQDTPSPHEGSSSTLNRSETPDSTQEARFGSAAEAEDGPRALPVLMLDLGGKEIVRADRPGTLKVVEAHDGSLKDLKTSQVTVQSKVLVEVHGDTSA